MDMNLNNIGNVPVTTSVIASLFPELKSPEKKVVWFEKQGYIIRLKRGLYVLNPELSGKMLSTELIANHLYAPSYISMSSALRYYGLIPEAVYMRNDSFIPRIYLFFFRCSFTLWQIHILQRPAEFVIFRQ